MKNSPRNLRPCCFRKGKNALVSIALPATKVRRGFSLILSLAVMSMVLMTVISLTAFLTLALKTSDAFLKRAKARNNAILAAKIALGDLQLNMGPDRRVSATAMILEEPTDTVGTQKNPQWLGTWNTYSSASGGTSEPYFGF